MKYLKKSSCLNEIFWHEYNSILDMNYEQFTFQMLAPSSLSYIIKTTDDSICINTNTIF